MSWQRHGWWSWLAAAATAAIAVAVPAPGGHAAVAPGVSQEPASAETARLASALPYGLGPATVPVARSSRLESVLRTALASSTAGSWGMRVDVAGVGEVATVNATRLFPPASTEKLFTLVPLLRSGPAALVTRITASAPAVGAVVHGDLDVWAAADPTLSSADLVRLARGVRAAGVSTVTGRLVLVVGSYPLAPRRTGWKSTTVPDDITPLSPFEVDRDAVATTAYRRNPTAANLALLRRDLLAAGVRIGAPSAIATSAPVGVSLVSHRSAPLAGIITHTLQQSDNVDAEAVYDVIGGSRAVALERTAVHAVGADADGSGLSSLDAETPTGEVALLDAVQVVGSGAALRAALPVACRSGTLRHAFCGTSASGRVWAKTGTLDHAKSLAGWTIDARGRLVTFAILCSDVRSTSAAMTAIEHAVLALRSSNL